MTIAAKVFGGAISTFDGTLQEGCIQDCIPPTLLQCVGMIEHGADIKSTFAGTLQEGCIQDCIPPILLQFVGMIEHGADIKSQLRLGASRSDLAMAQLLPYNCYAKNKEGAATHRHSIKRDTRFSLYMGMSVFVETRNRQLVEVVHDHGISIHICIYMSA